LIRFDLNDILLKRINKSKKRKLKKYLLKKRKDIGIDEENQGVLCKEMHLNRKNFLLLNI